MAQFINGPFDASQYNPQQGMGQLDVGLHKVVIENSTIDANKAGDGGLALFELRSIFGDSQGGQQAYRLNLYHSNPQTVEIAQRQMSALSYVLGVHYVEDTQQLHGIPFWIEVRKQKSDERYNEVFKVFDANGFEPKAKNPDPRIVALINGSGGNQNQQNSNNNASQQGQQGQQGQQSQQWQGGQQSQQQQQQTQQPAGNTQWQGGGQQNQNQNPNGGGQSGGNGQWQGSNPNGNQQSNDNANQGQQQQQWQGGNQNNNAGNNNGGQQWQQNQQQNNSGGNNSQPSQASWANRQS